MKFIEDPEIDFSELDNALCRIDELKAAIEDARAGNVTEDQHNQAAEYIADQQRYITTLKATIKAVQNSRDSLRYEVEQVKKQVFMQQREIDRLKALQAV